MTGSPTSAKPSDDSTRMRKMRGSAAARVWRLARKELREILRDRRTIVTLVLMPIIVYPLLSIAFQRFLLSSLRPAAEALPRIGVPSEEQGNLVREALMVGSEILKQRAKRKAAQAAAQAGDEAPAPQAGSSVEELSVSFFVVEQAESRVAEGSLDLSIRVVPRTGLPPLANGKPPVAFEIACREGDSFGLRVLRDIELRVGAANEFHLQTKLRQLGERGPVPVRIEPKSLAVAGPSNTSLKTLVPLILVLMTITGAVYPAIDLTAGERERGTLEMLVAAPVSRIELMLGKYVAVLTVALLTATANLTAMTTTILSMGLGKLVLGDAGLTPLIVLQVFGLLVLFAAFFSAVLLALTSFARSFKEAQAYLIPLMMVSIAPGLLSLTPDLQLNGLLAVTPLVNIVLLARDLFAGTPTSPILASVTIFSTLLFALAALGLAARVFGADAILYGSQGNWSDLWRGGPVKKESASVSGAMLCLALLFPALFLVNNILAQVAKERLEWNLVLRGGAQLTLFAGFPLIAAWLGNVSVGSGFRLQRAPLLAFLGAAILGLSLWPIAFQIVVLSGRLGIGVIDPEKMKTVAAWLASQRDISPAWVVVTFGFLPAISEELFFRGYLFGALRARTNGFVTILLSSAIFGAFHLVATDSLAVERLLPTTALGLALGWVRYRTGSVFPGMLLHAFHNSLLLLVAYYQKEVAAFLGLGEATQDNLPWTWVLAGILAAGLAALLIALATRQPRQTEATMSHPPT